MDAKESTKLENTILYLLKRSAHQRPVSTVLLKMLWYSDYHFYRENLTTITGGTYVALRNGPVLDGYKPLLQRMVEAQQLSLERVSSGYENPSLVYSALAQPDMTLFSEAEIDALETVIQQCAHKWGRTLSEDTHGRDEPWCLVWDGGRSRSKPLPEIVWRWLDNLPGEEDLARARQDVKRPHVEQALKRLRAEWQSEGGKQVTS